MSMKVRRIASTRLRAADDIGQGEDHAPDAGQRELDALYRKHRTGLLARLRRRTTPDNAQDLLQQVFVRFVALGRDRQASISNHAAYLHRSAGNVALDQHRVDQRRSVANHLSLENVELLAPDQVAALEARDMLNRLEAAMRTLRPRTREIFLAHRLDGYSYAEIAEQTGLSVKGVEKQMSRAIAQLDRILNAR